MRAAVFILIAGTVLMAPALAAMQRPLIVSQQDHSLADADDCEHFHTQNFTSFPAEARVQEQHDVDLSGIDVVTVRTSEEGGISVRGWDRPVARLTVCKAAVALTDVQARRTLGSVAVSIHNGQIVASGPEMNETQVWWAHMILRVPKGSNLDVASDNGGIAIRNMTGRVTAHAKNGGISIASCAGDNKVTTENGGIALEKISGHTDATTSNGPISFKLHTTTTPGIDARTEEEGEIFCNLKGCAAGGLGNWAANRKHLRIGRNEPSVRLSTTAAPITIEQVR